MNIMIDYDGTYTEAPFLWKSIITMFLLSDNNVYLVTSRDHDVPVEMEKDFEELGVPIIYCCWRAKRTVCEENGIFIDIWIDNDPKWIDTGFVDDHVEEIKRRHANV